MSTFHLLHMMDILGPQMKRAKMSRLRVEGVATFRDNPPRTEELPVTCQTLLRLANEKRSTSLLPRSASHKASRRRDLEISLRTREMDLQAVMMKKATHGRP